MTEDMKERLYYGALLHDLGMLAIPRAIVEAPRKLNSEEIKRVRTHVDFTEKVLNNMLREDVLSIVLGHSRNCIYDTLLIPKSSAIHQHV